MSEQSKPASSYGSGTGDLPPTPPTRRRRGRRLFGLVAALILILMGVLALFFLLPRSEATVTLTPVSKTLSGPVMGSYRPRTVSSEQQDLGSRVPLKPGTRACGTLPFKNYTPFWVTIPQGTGVTNVTGQGVWHLAEASGDSSRGPSLCLIATRTSSTLSTLPISCVSQIMQRQCKRFSGLQWNDGEEE